MKANCHSQFVLDNESSADDDSLPAGLMIKTSFFKIYGKGLDPDTGKVVEAEHFQCHEFPTFKCSFPVDWPTPAGTRPDWKFLREIIFTRLINHLMDSSDTFAERGRVAKETKWLDEYTSFVVLT